MAEKKYYWLKLHADFFQSDDIKVIQEMENGEKYIIFWLKLLLKAVTQAKPGILRYKEDIPYSDKILSAVTDTDVDIVRSAMKCFSELGMIQIQEDGSIWIDQVLNLIGSETDVARRVREHRRKRKQEIEDNCYNVTDVKQTCNTEKEIEIEKEIEKEKKIFFFGFLSKNKRTIALKEKLGKKKYREDYLRYVWDLCPEGSKRTNIFVRKLEDDTYWNEWSEQRDFENRSEDPQTLRLMFGN